MKLVSHSESWALETPFTISRGSRTAAVVVVATLESGGARGRGECTPYARYGESSEGTLAALGQAAQRLEAGEVLETVLAAMPPGAARNALDCAAWDWRCKQSGRRAHELAGLPAPRPVVTAYTLSLQPPKAMEEAARENAWRPLLKIKTGGEEVVESVEAVRRGAPKSRLIVDANEAWPEAQLPALLEAMARLGVSMVEQPLPAGRDAVLAGLPRPVPVFADESFHTRADLPECLGRYDGVNVKLDKTGGFTEALAACRAAKAHGLRVMCGCMLGTSLAMAPAMLLAGEAGFADLDAPLLLARDRPEGIVFEGSTMHPFAAALWG